MYWRNTVGLVRTYREILSKFWEIGFSIWTIGRRPEVRIDPNFEEFRQYFPICPSQTYAEICCCFLSIHDFKISSSVITNFFIIFTQKYKILIYFVYKRILKCKLEWWSLKKHQFIWNLYKNAKFHKFLHKFLIW